MYVGLSPKKNFIQKFQSRRRENQLWLDRLKIQRILVLFIQRSIGGSWKIWENISKTTWKVSKDMILSKKTISTVTVMNKIWPLEDVKLFVNVRFFSKLKKLNESLKENSKKMSKHWNKLLSLCLTIWFLKKRMYKF